MLSAINKLIFGGNQPGGDSESSVINVSHCPEHLSIAFAATTEEDKLQGDLSTWSDIREIIVADIVKNKPALIYCYEPDFQLPTVLNSDIQTRKHDNPKCFLAYSSKWTETDVEELCSQQQFEGAGLWFQVLSSAAAESFDLKQLDVKALTEALKRFADEEEELPEDVNLECVGCVSDGEELLWHRPDADAVPRIIENLTELCGANGFQLCRSN